jgi:hypothetical protein
MNRSTIYILLNALFLFAVMAGYGMHGTSVGVHPLYLVPLFALCSSPILDTKVLNGPYSLLVLFSFDYFVMFGALDFQHLLFGTDGSMVQEPDAPITLPELAILLGALLVQISYRVACRAVSRNRPTKLPKDWSETTLLVVGVVLYVVCARLNWEFNVDIITDSTSEATKKGLASISALEIMIILIARLTQSLALLIIAYVQCRYRRTYMIPLVFGVVLWQLYFGFVIDFKTEALIGGVLVILTNLLVNARVPIMWVALMIVVTIVAFPLLQANRAVRSDKGQNNTQISQNVFETFKKALEAKDKVNTGRDRAQTALERLTLKGSVEILVNGTGSVAPFQNGYTLSPVITVFIPRILWPEKPAIETGRILNRDFHLSESADTYMSPSHIGELYWNFGWPGILVGMSIIGMLLGTIGAKCDLSAAPTITRILVLVVTVRLLILGSEGEFANAYTSWMRSMLGIGVMHLLWARIPIPWRDSTPENPPEARSEKASPPMRRPLPTPFR